MFFTTKQEGKGTGLGLAMVRRAALQNGGCIDVTTRIGEGTTFVVYFPRITGADQARADEEPRIAPRGAGHGILLVEDDDAVRKSPSRILVGAGYRVVEASTAAEAVVLFDAPNAGIDLVVSDLILPDFNAPVLLDRLRDIRPETRMLCLSGYFDVRAIRPTASATSAVLLRKPVEADVLLQAVGELIEASRP